MKIHPDAMVFPNMGDEEFARFADGVEANGLLEPITLLKGAILDGRHRHRACAERGVEPRYVEWDASCEITPLEWVISKNLHRRQLTVSQRAALAAELKERLAEAGRKRMSTAGRSSAPGRPAKKGSPEAANLSKKTARDSAVIAGQQFGVGKESVKSAARVRAEDPELFEDIKAGRIGTRAAERKLGHVVDPHKRRPRMKLKDALNPLRQYLKNWDEERLRGTSPREAKKLLALVQEVDAGLFEVERALEERTIISRALQ